MIEELKILVVEEEELSRSLIYDVLTDSGYKVDIASCGEEAVEKIQQDKYAIVITDLKMRAMSGIALLRQIKEKNPQVCVIVVTTNPSVDSVIEAMREGAYDYIVKPFNIEEVKLAVRRAVERQFLLNEVGQKEFYREVSIHDGLTGIYNHSHFHEVLLRAIEQCRRYKHPLSLLMIDIDNFKKYNDTYGHQAGDELLCKAAVFFEKAVRIADMVFRYGGDEFAVICSETSKAGGQELAKRLLDLENQKIPLTISIGVSCFPDDADNKDNLIKKSDEMLYEAKRLGRNRICVFGQNNQQTKQVV